MANAKLIVDHRFHYIVMAVVVVVVKMMMLAVESFFSLLDRDKIVHNLV
jgi:hypothetical protein